MKKTINKFLTKISTTLMLSAMLTVVPIQSAQATDSTTDIVSTIISAYNNMLGVYADMMFQFDSQIATYVANNQAIINSNISDELKKSVDYETLNAFSGIQAQNKKDLLLVSIKAGDDVDINYANTSIYGIADDLIKQVQNVDSQKNNSLFNVEYLIGPDVYKDAAAQDNALAYLEHLKSTVPPPPVIRMGATFDVPISNPNDPTQKSITVGQKTPLTSSDLSILRKDLQNDQDYRSYKKGYRAIVAIRNMLLDNLQYSYQIRLPQSNGKSLEQMRNEQINSRLSSDYYQKMSTASTDTVNREMLFVLGEISSQLNAIRKQNERILIMNSTSALSQTSAMAAALTANSQKIGQLIYCKVPANKNESLCKASSTPDTSALTDQLTQITTTTATSTTQ
jgi:hypothetical protein